MEREARKGRVRTRQANGAGREAGRAGQAKPAATARGPARPKRPKAAKQGQGNVRKTYWPKRLEDPTQP